MYYLVIDPHGNIVRASAYYVNAYVMLGYFNNNVAGADLFSIPRAESAADLLRAQPRKCLIRGNYGR